MSARPPRPSLVCVVGSAPRGSRSASTLALIRRISTTSRWRQPALGVPELVRRADELPPPGACRRRPAGPAAAPAVPRPPRSSPNTRGSDSSARTIGPFLPSGRRSASISSGGSGRGPAQQPGHQVGDGGRVGPGHLLVLPGQRLHDEHHVGVGGVAEFRAAEPAHADHREPGPESAAFRGHLLDRGLVGGRDGGLGDAAQPAGDVRHGDQAEQVAAGQPEHLLPAGRPGHVDGLPGRGRPPAAGQQRGGHGLRFRRRAGRRRRPAAAAPRAPW